jgi:phospholipid transport system substrate-binding protein
MRRTSAAILTVLFALCLPSALAAAISPTQSAARTTVEKTVESVISVLRDGSLSHGQKLRSLEVIVYGRFDLHWMSKLVLARNWKRFSAAQQTAYVSEFKQYLSNTYGDRLSRYDGFDVEIVGSRDEPRGDVTVRTTVVGGEFEGALLDYRLRLEGADWKVIDVIIEGISLVSNFRDQFKSVVSSGGPELLLKKLKEKNATGTPAPPPRP